MTTERKIRQFVAENLDSIMNDIREDDNIGRCVECGATQYSCEPDARGYECEDCGKEAVYGAEELLFYA